jgi:hypothetical protein
MSEWEKRQLWQRQRSKVVSHVRDVMRRILV